MKIFVHRLQHHFFLPLSLSVAALLVAGAPIAQAAGQTAVANRLWRMPVASKVASLECKVCGDNHFAAGRRSQNRAIVANAKCNRLTLLCETTADLLD